ncbi:MAG TPA: helix-turn-helix transcriptional regulator [Rhizomicrobium sp.]|jgi:transcriptional regulator with XRE-family HTH domain
MNFRRLVAINVQRLRLGRDPQWTQQTLAAEAQITLAYMNGIERAKRNPSFHVASRLAKALDVTMEEFLRPIPPGYVPPKNMPRGKNVHHKGRKAKA